MKKPWPSFKTDEEEEHFVETADLTDYDFSQMVPMRFELEKKSGALNMRLPHKLLEAMRSKAKTKGIPLTRYVRMLMEQDLARS